MGNKFNLHQRSIFDKKHSPFSIFYTSLATDNYINMSNGKESHALENLWTSFNPVFFKINWDAESQINFVRTSVLLSF